MITQNHRTHPSAVQELETATKTKVKLPKWWVRGEVRITTRPFFPQQEHQDGGLHDQPGSGRPGPYPVSAPADLLLLHPLVALWTTGVPLLLLPQVPQHVRCHCLPGELPALESRSHSNRSLPVLQTSTPVLASVFFSHLVVLTSPSVPFCFPTTRCASVRRGASSCSIRSTPSGGGGATRS